MKPEPMAASTVTPEPATTWYGNRRHYSADLHSDERHPRTGRLGLSLCSTTTNQVRVFDQEWLNGNAGIYSHLGKIKVAELPPCKKCVRNAGLPDPSREG